MVFIYETLVQIAFRELDPEKIANAVGEAKELALLRTEKFGVIHEWKETYIERHMADPELYYESLLPKTLRYQDYVDIQDDIDKEFWTSVEKICQT